MRICYKILTHNETDSLEKLLDFLFENIKEQDHIIVCDDFSEAPTRKILAKYVIEDAERLKQYDYFQRKFEGDFAEHHNFVNGLVREEFDYIFSIDADEIPNKWLIENIHEILESNDVDLIWVPRVNTVEGITEEHIQKWGWRVTINLSIGKMQFTRLLKVLKKYHNSHQKKNFVYITRKILNDKKNKTNYIHKYKHNNEQRKGYNSW